MKQHLTMRRGGLAVAALLLAGIAAAPAQAGVGPSDFDAAVPCDAFHRTGNGTWTATEPVTLHINNGMNVSFRPGDSVLVGKTVGGVAVPAILDRHCGNL